MYSFIIVNVFPYRVLSNLLRACITQRLNVVRWPFTILFFRVTSVSANDGKWHHICTSWENNAGLWKFYKDGRVKEQGGGLKTGHVIRSGGSLVLGIEQDPPGVFEPGQFFRGMMTNLNVWDHVLSAEEIEISSKSCLSGEGNVVRWTDLIRGRRGKTKLFIPSPCKSLNP